MLKRTEKEIAADWYRLWANYFNAVINLTRGLGDKSPKLPPSIERDLFYCIDELSWHSHCLKIDSPCHLLCPPDDGTGPLEILVTDIIGGMDSQNNPFDHSELRFPKTRPLKISINSPLDPFDFSPEQASYNIAPNQTDWFYYDKHGEKIIRSLKYWIKSDPVNLRYQICPEQTELVPVDVQQFAKDLRELSERLDRCDSGEVINYVEYVGDLIDRLWRQLNNGNVDRLETSIENRKLLSRAWVEVEWSQRLIERGLGYVSNLRKHMAYTLREPGETGKRRLAEIAGELESLVRPEGTLSSDSQSSLNPIYATLEEIEQNTPDLDMGNPSAWAKANDLKVHGETADVTSLKVQRSRGKKLSDGSFGVCETGRIWRKERRDVWYYIPSLLPVRDQAVPLISSAIRLIPTVD